MEPTSVIAWRMLIASGRLKGRQAEALRILAEKGPMTAQELQQHADHPGLWKRLSELEKKGFAEIVGTRHCLVTQEIAKVWRLKTQFSPPTPLPPPENPGEVQISMFEEA